MKITKNNGIYLGSTLLFGLAAGILRFAMLKNGVDEKGLLEPWNICCVALWALSIGFLAGVALRLRKQEAHGSFEHNFPACKLRMTLSIAGGVVMVAESFRVLMGGSLPMGILGIAAGACMMVTGVFRGKGTHPHPVFHIVVCIFFILRLIFSFQDWSADPQLQDYALQLLACVCLMMFAFHRASWDAGTGKRGSVAFFGLAAAYFCLASLTDGTMPLFFLAGALWAFGAGVNMDDVPVEMEKA